MSENQTPSNSYTNLLRRLGGLFRKNSKQELREYLQEAQENQIIDSEEATMMAGVLAVSEKRVRDVMLPKSKMVVVPENMTFVDTINLVIKSGHSRFPVEQENDIIGILLAKDLLAYSQKDKKDYNVTRIMHPVYHIPESKPLNVMLHEFRLQHLHMAIVTGEYGDITGLITIEDVLEEIVGEIDDEHDSEDNDKIKKLDKQHFAVSALTEVKQFNHFFKTNLDANINDTIGGFVLSYFGYIPKNGESVTFANFNFVVKEASDRRIITLLVSRVIPTDNGITADNDS